MDLNLKKEDIDKIFNGAQTVVEASHDIFNVMHDHHDAYSRRNMSNQQGQPYPQPVQYGYGYGEIGMTSYFGNTRTTVQNGYPGFTDPSYGSGGMW